MHCVVQSSFYYVEVVPSPLFQKTLLQNVILATYHIMIDKYNDLSIIFIDVSKSSLDVGCSVVLNRQSSPFLLPVFFSTLPSCTELYAINVAITCLVDGNISEKFLVCSNSLSALDTLYGTHEIKINFISKDILFLLSVFNCMFVSRGYLATYAFVAIL